MKYKNCSAEESVELYKFLDKWFWVVVYPVIAIGIITLVAIGIIVWHFLKMLINLII